MFLSFFQFIFRSPNTPNRKSPYLLDTCLSGATSQCISFTAQKNMQHFLFFFLIQYFIELFFMKRMEPEKEMEEILNVDSKTQRQTSP